MNRRQLAAILRLRWTLFVRGLRRGSPAGAVFAAVIGALALLSALGGFSISLFLGLILLPMARPEHLLLLWIAVVVLLLFLWAAGVLAELQRSEPFSLTKLLLLPVSLRGAFLLNYSSSLLSFSLLTFVPTMLGLTLAMIVTEGSEHLLLVPLIAAFLVMVTAVTYQFQGWLAALMANKRRRGTVVAIVTVVFVVLVNAPNILRFTLPDNDEGEIARRQNREAVARVEERQRDGSLSAEEAAAELSRLEARRLEARKARNERELQRVVGIARRWSVALPPAWLAYGAWSVTEGRLWPALLSTLGMLSIGGLSLARAYQTTLRLYRGELSGRASRRARKRDVGTTQRTGAGLVEWSIPGCTDRVSAIATAGLRSLSRSPQAKLLLLTPVILLTVFGALLFGGRGAEMPPAAAALLALGTAGLIMLTLSQLFQNQFGFDGDGFRTFVLSSTPRHEILLGKNLSLAPLCLTLGLGAILVLAIVSPIRPTHVLASLLQLLSIYLVCCMLGNLISILGPMAVSPSTLKPVRPGAATLVKQLAFALLIPVSIPLTAIPLGLEELLRALGWSSPVPIYLLLSAAELPLIVWIYRRALTAQGRLLAAREQRVLEIVTANVA